MKLEIAQNAAALCRPDDVASKSSREITDPDIIRIRMDTMKSLALAVHTEDVTLIVSWLDT